MSSDRKDRTKLTRRERQSLEVTHFIKAVGRKSITKSGRDPNDRAFDPDRSRQLRKLPPADFEKLAMGDE